jgi:hypothetical protein
MSAAEHALGGMKQSAYLPFFYPPPFLLVCWGLAWLPYWTAFAVFMASGLVPLAAAARVLLPVGMRWLPFVAYPGIWITFLSGQNGLIFAACLAWFMLLGDRRPGGAGACLGVLVCKPHLGLGVPFALAASGRWRSFAAAGACALVLCAASWAVMGAAPWVAFAQAGRAASTAITAFLLPFGSSVVAAGTHVQVAPLVIGALLVLLARDRGRGAHAPIETEHGWAVARPE